MASPRASHAGLLRRRNIMRHERWCDALFLHYTVDAAVLQAKIPAGLTVDNYLGSAVVSIVALSECGCEPICPVAFMTWMLRPLRGSHDIVTVRTYVRPTSGDGPPGIYYFSLDCSSWLPSAGARLFFNLPYKLARVARSRTVTPPTVEGGSDGTTYFEVKSRRCLRTLLLREVATFFHAQWQPVTRPAAAEGGSLDEFVVER